MKRADVNLKALVSASIEHEKAKVHAIHVDNNLPRIVDEGIEILTHDETIFARAGSLVRVREVDGSRKRDRIKREAGSLTIENYPNPALREWLISRTFFFKIEKEDDDETGKAKDVQCATTLPRDLIPTLKARSTWPGIRPLEGIVQAPTLRHDGSILQIPGYDAESELLFEPGADEFPKLPDAPTLAEAKAALAYLLDIVCDVPFADDVHRSAWVACVLTAVARSFVDGCAPLFAIDANIRGAGKSLLADLTSIIATARSAPRMAQPEHDAESRKVITSLLMEGERLVLMDNITRPLGCASLDALLTSEYWRDRILGASKTINVPNRCVWMATGNNLSFVSDTVRRTLHIRLDSPDENPEDRAGFKYPDLRSHVKQHRGELAAAALTILRAFVVAGRPCKVNLWGSFEGWSKTIAAACLWVGLPDPQLTRVELEESADATKSALVTILKDFKILFSEGSTIKNAIACLYPPLPRGEERRPDRWSSLREAFEELAPPLPGRAPEASKVAYAFRALKKRVVSGRMLDNKRDTNDVGIWFVSEPKQRTPRKTDTTEGNGARGMQAIPGMNSLSVSREKFERSVDQFDPPSSPASPAEVSKKGAA